MLCNACRNKHSNERCLSRALLNLQFCGKHAKAKHPKLWVDSESEVNAATTIQKIWRGWIIRKYLELAGPGVLKRSICHNTEDVITMEERIHPFEYFAFKEGEKIFWFDIKSLFQISIGSLKPLNPYTRQEICCDTRKRLKECIYYRQTRRLPLVHDKLYFTDKEKVFNMRWTTIVQMLEEHLFIEVDPIYFTSLNRTQLWEFTALLRADFLAWAQEHNTLHSRRTLYYVWLNTCWKRQTLTIDSPENIASFVGAVLLRILKDSKQPSDVCFRILTALHSL